MINIRAMRLSHVTQLEASLSIQEKDRWGRDHNSRITIADQLNHQDFVQAIDHLERLVVMRLFELTKLNQSGTGE